MIVYFSFLVICFSLVVLQVREIVTVLDLDVLYYPCPRNGPNFRPKAFQLGGKKQFPYMVLIMASHRLITYKVCNHFFSYFFSLIHKLLREHYKDAVSHHILCISMIFLFDTLRNSFVALICYSGLLSGLLCMNCFVSMSLVYIALKKEHMLPELLYFYGSNLVDKFTVQVDPNTGAAMYESDDIIKYLVDKYGTFSTHIISCVILLFFYFMLTS